MGVFVRLIHISQKLSFLLGRCSTFSAAAALSSIERSERFAVVFTRRNRRECGIAWLAYERQTRDDKKNNMCIYINSRTHIQTTQKHQPSKY